MKTGKVSKVLMSRRTFLAGTAAASGGIALYGLTGCKKQVETIVEEPLTPVKPIKAARVKGDIVYNACPRNCHDTCTILTEVVDGRIVRLKGDPDNPITAGGLCVKMNHYINWVYHPDRILHPMKRVGAKGEGKFERISWDEAYDTIAEKFNGIIDEFGSEAIMPYSYSGNLGIINNYGVPYRFFHKIGASHLERAICSDAGSKANPYTFGHNGGVDPESYARTQMYVSWGINEAATNVHAIKFIQQAKENGAKVVVVNPVRTALANQADLFLQIKPGTDGALALGVMNILIKEDLYDENFVESYTIGFDELVKETEKYPVEEVAEITGLSKEMILEFAHMYGNTKPSIVRVGYGMQRNSNGGNAVRAISLLPPLVGMIGVDGGGYVYINSYFWGYDWDALRRFDLYGDRELRHLNMNELGKVLTGELEATKELPVKGMFVYNSNPMAIAPNVNLVRKGLEREDLFVVVADLFQTDTVDYADIVLPAASFFEYEDIQQDYLGYYVRHNTPAITPLGECKSNLDMFHGLARHMGFEDDCFKETAEDACRIAINPDNKYMEGITYDKLRENHWMRINETTPFADKKFPTPSGKIEFYSEKLKDAGHHPVAEFIPFEESAKKSPELYAKYPLSLLSPASKNLLNSQMHNIPQIQTLMGEPVLYVSPKDAEARGLAEGDLVDAFNDRGKTQFRVLVTNATRDGAVVTFACPWPKLIPWGTSVNELTPDRLGDMAGVSTFHTNLIEIKKA